MCIESLLIIVLLWQSVIQKFTGFTYLDEIIVLFFGINFIGKKFLNKKNESSKLEKNEQFAFVFTIIFYLIGCISTIIFNYQESYFYGMLSGIFSVKSLIAYFGARFFFSDRKIERNDLKLFLCFIEYPIIITFILLSIGQVIPLFEYDPSRVILGIKSSNFIFSHPTELACYAIVSLFVSVFLRTCLGYKKKIWRNYLPAIFIVIVSGRYKALAFIAIFILLRVILPYMKRFKLSRMLIGLPVVFMIAREQIIYYFFDVNSSRGALYYYSLKIAKDHFPLGSGFGTYGTEFSRDRYSLLYGKYGLSNIYGLQENFSSFITDTMWAGVIGEAGFLGFIFYALFFVFIFKFFHLKIKNKQIKFLLICFVVYGLFESIADSFFMSSRGVLLFVTVAYMYHLYSNKFSKE